MDRQATCGGKKEFLDQSKQLQPHQLIIVKEVLKEAKLTAARNKSQQTSKTKLNKKTWEL